MSPLKECHDPKMLIFRIKYNARAFILCFPLLCTCYSTYDNKLWYKNVHIFTENLECSDRQAWTHWAAGAIWSTPGIAIHPNLLTKETPIEVSVNKTLKNIYRIFSIRSRSIFLCRWNTSRPLLQAAIFFSQNNATLKNMMPNIFRIRVLYNSSTYSSILLSLSD